MTNLFYFQVEEVPGSHTIFFIFFCLFFYPILINYLPIYLSSILMFDFFFFHIHFIFIYLFIFYLFAYLCITYLFIYSLILI